MTQTKAKFEKMTADATATQKEGLDAVLLSSGIALKGGEDIVKTWIDLVQGAAARNAQGFKSLLNAKTLNEFTETQSRIAQENLDEFLSGTTKMSELGIRVATEAFEPINDQLSRSLKKVSDLAAA